MKYLFSFFLSVSLLIPETLIACCAENIHQLFPIGEWENEIVLVEAKLKRNCGRLKEAESGMGFNLKGEVNLVRSKGNSIFVIAKIDSIDVLECECRPTDQYDKSAYESILKTSYLKAIKLTKSLDGFELAKTKSISFNDTINLSVREEITDSSYRKVFSYKDVLEARLQLTDIVSCFPDKLTEIREYETPSYLVSVIRLRCRYLDEQILERQTKRFKKLKTAFWKERALWHGTSKDYFSIKRK